MERKAEGIHLSSNQGSFESISPKNDVEALLKKSRQQFINDILKAIGDLKQSYVPLGIKPTLQRLIQECDHYLEYGHERSFIKLCNDAIEVSGQGWSYLSYWISTEQNLCYSIFWSLKAAMENHRKQLLIYQAPSARPSKMLSEVVVCS
jgi:hypothetical protein